VGGYDIGIGLAVVTIGRIGKVFLDAGCQLDVPLNERERREYKHRKRKQPLQH
jgi:hypothetical protein